MTPLLTIALLAQTAIGPAAPAATHQSAVDLYKNRAYSEAAAAFRKVLDTEKPGTPDYEESLLLLGHSLYFLNRAPEAIPYLEKARKINEVLYMLGALYLRTRDLPKAAATFSEMYGVPPASASGHLIAGQMMTRLGFEDDAEKELRSALQADPKLPQVHYLLGELAMYRGRAEEAKGYLKDEIAINPDSAMAYYKMGDAYTRLSDWTAAIAFLQKSIWLNPDFSGPYILLGKAYLKTGKLADAEGVLRHAVKVDPNNYSAHYLLGQTLIQQGRAEEGRQMLDLSQKLKPT